MKNKLTMLFIGANTAIWLLYGITTKNTMLIIIAIVLGLAEISYVTH